MATASVAGVTFVLAACAEVATTGAAMAAVSVIAVINVVVLKEAVKPCCIFFIIFINRTFNASYFFNVTQYAN